MECDCGGKVVGQRTGSHQKRPCPLCEHPVFVLPANVYPRPKPKFDPKKAAAKATGGTSSRSGPNAVVDDNPPPIPTKASAPAPAQRGAERAASTPHTGQPTLLQEPSRPLMTPLRLVTAAILLMSSLTIGGLWHRHRIEVAKATVTRAADAGMAAIVAKDFVKAAQELEKAHLAVNVIRRTDSAANDIRRLSREATAMAKLASSSLIEFLNDTLAIAKPGQPQIRLSSLDKGAWVIFDANVLPDTEEDGRFIVDFPLVVDGTKVEIEIRSSTFRKLPHTDESGEPPRVIFAAQLDQLSSPQGEPPKAVLTLNGTPAFLWSTYDNYVAIGYRPIDEENERQTRAVLEQQLEAQR